MKQYRITQADFVLPGESGDADAVMDSQDLAEIKRLAGITGLLEAEAGMYTGNNTVPQANDENTRSPVGSDISFTAKERNDLLKEFHVMPGTDLWFLINFTKPFFNGSLRSKVEEYLKQHPDARPRSFPNNN
ncbi:hypothetical protein UFOVP112_179 [uncultured Caudovirales phage]|uniref:Uncharacterized protein n=1 Tax=uncultured Caudovirales phage TaxID=2100421 RepID=A0A6J5L405_9CAUD|nr:hypothetical protein UFOVP112_179 [uncultured Caudovirales phage]